MKLTITGIVEKVGGIQPLRKGFRQVVILEQPEIKDEFDRVTTFAQFFPISIFSNQQADSRFLGSRDMRSKKSAAVYLKGERWFTNRDFQYAIKMNLERWLH